MGMAVWLSLLEGFDLNLFRRIGKEFYSPHSLLPRFSSSPATATIENLGECDKRANKVPPSRIECLILTEC